MILVDLSNNNGNLLPILDAAKKAGVKGCLFKISEGLSFTDSHAAGGIAHARKLGLKVGGYHFARGHAARDEAAHFVHAAHAAGLWRKGDIRPVLDYEVGQTGHASPWRDAFYARVSELANGAHCILYTSPRFNPRWLTPKSRLQRRLWVAHYTNASKPQVPVGYSRGNIWLWQFTDQHQVGGARVDASKVMGLVPRVTLARNCLSRAC